MITLIEYKTLKDYLIFAISLLINPFSSAIVLQSLIP